ncbi:B-box zinc finger protein [Serratia fonticola]|uniref:hypothetical protein n=1 Tax=Serratia fonticola TaxID=47917 RepID=UPI0021B73591|nr:hypothetical protein [Serratia fonticola]
MKIKSQIFALLAFSTLIPIVHATPAEDKARAMSDFMNCGNPRSDKCLEAYQRIKDAEKAEKEQVIREIREASQ